MSIVDSKPFQVFPKYQFNEGGWLAAFPTQNGGDLIVVNGLVYDEDCKIIEIASFKKGHKIKPNFAQRFSNGDFLFVEARQTTKYPNAFICSSSGDLISAFQIGDAINKIIIDRLDRIWVGYFDEGVFGDFKLSQNGLNCFDREWNTLYSFESSNALIDDCYNLNIDENNHAYIAPYCHANLIKIYGKKSELILKSNDGNVPYGIAKFENYIVKFGGLSQSEDGLITIHDLLNNEKRVIKVVDENRNQLPMYICNTYQNRALICANEKVYAIEIAELLSF